MFCFRFLTLGASVNGDFPHRRIKIRLEHQAGKPEATEEGDPCVVLLRISSAGLHRATGVALRTVLGVLRVTRQPLSRNLWTSRTLEVKDHCKPSLAGANAPTKKRVEPFIITFTKKININPDKRDRAYRITKPVYTLYLIEVIIA